MSDFTGKTALITGASRGIGRAIAIELAAGGATVIINYNSNTDAANAVLEEITANGGTAHIHQADVSDADAVTAMFKIIKKEHGGLDILVNNAGITRDNVIMRLKPADFDDVLNTNLRSAWLCSKAASRLMMKARYGRIINVSSVSGIAGQAGQSNYAASKAGLIGLTKSLARELADRNVTVNAIAPGYIDTDMTADLADDMKAQILDFIPMKRQGTPEEVAKATAFLAGDDAGYITGQVLVVDGGMVM
ncbi:MAG: 3-oxoacyl-[acyl-carrier-protein] reductase [Aggregatilineales bacterium]